MMCTLCPAERMVCWNSVQHMYSSYARILQPEIELHAAYALAQAHPHSVMHSFSVVIIPGLSGGQGGPDHHECKFH